MQLTHDFNFAFDPSKIDHVRSTALLEIARPHVDRTTLFAA